MGMEAGFDIWLAVGEEGRFDWVPSWCIQERTKSQLGMEGDFDVIPFWYVQRELRNQ